MIKIHDEAVLVWRGKNAVVIDSGALIPTGLVFIHFTPDNRVRSYPIFVNGTVLRLSGPPDIPEIDEALVAANSYIARKDQEG